MQALDRQRSPAWRIFAAVFGLVGIVTAGQALAAGANPDDPSQVALGKAAYQKNCASCHGVNLEGQANWRARKPDGKLPAPPHDRTGHTWHHPDGNLFQITKKGVKPPLAPIGYKSDMPGFESILSDDEIWAILAYIKKSWPPMERARQKKINDAYR